MRRVMMCALALLTVLEANNLGQTPNKKEIQHPVIVARFHRFGLTSELPPTTIYTPRHWGTFRISTVMVLVTSNGQDGGWLGSFAFTNNSGSGSVTMGYGLGNLQGPGAIAQGETIVVNQARKALTFSTSAFGNPAGSKYNVFITIERI